MPLWISQPGEYFDPIDLNGKYTLTKNNGYPEYSKEYKDGRKFIIVSFPSSNLTNFTFYTCTHFLFLITENINYTNNSTHIKQVVLSRLGRCLN